MFNNLPPHIAEPQTRARTGANRVGEFSQTIVSALEQPLGYPPVKEWMFPGDKVAIVLQASLLRPVEVAGVALEYCQANGIEMDDVLLVVLPATAARFGIGADQLVQTEAQVANGEPPATLPVTVTGKTVHCHVHDQRNPFGLAYLAANEAGDPVHVNRELVDADVVLPIGCPTSGCGTEIRDCIYPDYGSIDRAEPFRALTGTAVQRADEVQLANDNLGSFFTLQIVYSPGGDVASAVAGQRNQAVAAATELANEQWTIDPVFETDLVIATIEEPGRAQTWGDFASALIASATAAPGTGPIVIWSAIKQQPDRGTRKSLQRQFDDSGKGKLSRAHRRVASITAERPVFLHSELPQSSIEELGIGFIADQEDILRIAAKASNGVLLRDAHRVNLVSSEASEL